MADIQVGPLGGVMLYGLLALVVVGLLVAPTLGGAIVWAVGAALAVAVLFFLTRRIYLKLVGRR